MLLLHLSNRIGLSVDMIMESYRKLLRESEACVFLRLFSSTTLPQGKRSPFKRKLVFKKFASGFWVDMLQGKSWLLVLLGPSVNATK